MKKNKLKSIITGFTVASLLLTSTIANCSSLDKSISISYRNIKICVDSRFVSPKDANGNSVEPFIYNGTTYLPVRAVGEALGKKVSWDGNKYAVYIENETSANTAIRSNELPNSVNTDKSIGISFRNIKIYVNNNAVNPKDANGDSIEPFIYGGTTYLPVRAIGEALGKKVSWDGSTGTVYIKSIREQFVSDAPPITWYFIGPGPQRDTAEIESEVNKYLKDKLNVSLKLNCLDWGIYDNKITAMEASGEPFDICFTAAWMNDYYQNAKSGTFVDLTDMMDKYAPKTKALLGENAIKAASVGGRLYAIPSIKEMAHNWIFCLKHDLVNKYKIDTSKIKKFEDIEPYLKVVHDNEPNIYPFEAVQGESPYRVLNFEKILDDDTPGAFDPSSLKVINDFESPEAKAFYKTLHKWYNAGYIRKDADTVHDYYADEKAGKIFAHVKSGKPFKSSELSLQQSVNWDQVDLTTPVVGNIDTNGSMQAISKTSKDPAKALQFLELFNTDKYLNNLINFGIENEHYIKTGANTIALAPGTNEGADSGYNLQTGWMFGNQFLNYTFPTESPQKWEKYKEFNSSAVPSKLLGFYFNPDPVKNEIAEIKSIKKQYSPLLETGKGDPDVVLPEMTAKMKEAGLDKVLAEMQSQVDEFLAKSK